MNSVQDFLWVCTSVFELVLKQQIFVEVQVRLKLEESEWRSLHQQIEKRAEFYNLSVDFLYIYPFVKIRFFPAPGAEGTDTEICFLPDLPASGDNEQKKVTFA
jgi:hypothetical protein